MIRWLRWKRTQVSLYGLPALWGVRKWRPSERGYELRSRLNRCGARVYYRARRAADVSRAWVKAVPLDAMKRWNEALMPCEPVKLAGGTVAIVCTGRARSRRCVVCGELGADRLCDYPTEWRSRYGKRQAHTTCDKPLHRRCAKADGQHDYCPEHPEHGQLGLAL